MSLFRTSIRTLTCLLTAATLSSGTAKALETVTLGQVTSTSLTFGPVFAGIELGFFKEEGIELKLLEFQGGTVLLPQIANKSVTMGFAAVDPVVQSRQPGRDALPLKFFYNGARESIWEFVVLEDSPIKTLNDLRGKTIGIGANTNGNVPITRALLKELGMTANKDYSFLPIGVGAPAFRATLNGSVATYNTFDTNIAAFETTGAKLRRLPQPQKYLDLFANGFVAHEDTLRDKPKLIAGFGRALTKGILVCQANPDFCVKNFWKHNPTLKPSGGSDAEVLAKGRHMLLSRMRKYVAFPAGAKRTFGEYSDKAWDDFVEVLHEGGELSTKAIDIRSVYTNAFVAAFNDFDAKAIVEQARALH